MTPNDSEIELLIRRQAMRPHESAALDHLDADALNAFAEGALPPAARSNYVSHLADCADCRKLASQLSIHATAMSAAQTAQVPSEAHVPWWKSLSSLIAVPALRYAALTVVLVAVVGIAFLVWRRSNSARTELVAQNQPAATPASAVKTDSDNAAAKNGQTDQTTQTDQSRVAKALPQSTAMPQGQEKLSQPMADAPPPPSKPEAEGITTKSEPSLAARSAAPVRPEATPSFAPPPPGEANEAKSREQQNVGGITHGGPRRNESYKVLDRSRSAEVAKEEGRVSDATKVDEDRKDKNQPKQESESGTFSMSAGNRDTRSEPRKSENKPAPSSEVAPSPRSAGGRKFQRQGSAWVDVKFKSSMAVRNVARGSEEFAALDSRLRSIAQQLSGEIIVVWKGKAYRIQ